MGSHPNPAYNQMPKPNIYIKKLEPDTYMKNIQAPICISYQSPYANPEVRPISFG